MPVTTHAMLASSAKRKGWVLKSSSDDDRVGTGFNARDLVVAWNKGLGPSKNSIPSRKSSLATEGGPFIPPSYRPTYTSWKEAGASFGSLLSPPPNNVKPVPTAPFRTALKVERPQHRSPSGRVIGPASYSDHQRIMASSSPRSSPTKARHLPRQSGTHYAQQETLQLAGSSNASGAVYRRNNMSLLDSVKPMPSVTERSNTPDPEEVLSSSAPSPEKQGAIAVMKQGGLRIELPPSQDYKSAYPAILVDSSHLNDDNGYDGRDNDDDNSSWPSTPSTTPLEVYMTAAAVEQSMAAASGGPMTDGAAVRAAYLAASPCPSPSYQTEEKVRKGNRRDVFGVARPALVGGSSPVTTPTRANFHLPSMESPLLEERVTPSRNTFGSTDIPASSPLGLSPPQSETKPGHRSLSFEIPAPMPKRSSEGVQANLPRRKGMNGLFQRTADKLAGRSRPGGSETEIDNIPGSPAANGRDPRVVVKRAESLDHPAYRSPQEKRRSFELRPILLNSSANQSRVSFVSSVNASSPQVHLSSGNVGGLQYSKRWSEQSYVSSTTSLAMPGRRSADQVMSDGQCTPSPRPFTVPSLTPGNGAAQLPSSVYSKPTHPSAAMTPSDSYTAFPARKRPVFASSMPSLHQGPDEEEERLEREVRRSLLQSHIGQHKGRAIRDSDSIAGWIQVSTHELPNQSSDAQHPYGNGGSGIYSNERKGLLAGNNTGDASGGKPWKFGRFSASVALPHGNATAALNGHTMAKRSISILRRPKSANGSAVAANLPSEHRNRNPSSISVRMASGASSTGTNAFTPNMGWTKANRNATMQHLCVMNMSAALGAAALNVGSLGAQTVPFPLPDLTRPVEAPVEDAQEKAKTEMAAKKRKNLFKRESRVNASGNLDLKATARPTSQVAILKPSYPLQEVGLPSLVPPKLATITRLRNESQTHVAFLTPTKEFTPSFNLVDQLQTFKSIHPEMGHWQENPDRQEDVDSASSEEDRWEAFDDRLDFNDDDLDNPEDDNEEKEVPRPFSGRPSDFEPSMLNVFFSSIRGTPEPEASPISTESFKKLEGSPQKLAAFSGSCLDLSKGLQKLSRKFSLRNGSITNRGKEINLCVEEPAPANSGAAPTHWKAVKVAHLASSTCEDLGYLGGGELRSPRKTKAMNLEAEVAKGQFANFVGISSPKRVGKKVSLDASRPRPAALGVSQQDCSPVKQRDAVKNTDNEELFISKGLTSYVVRRGQSSDGSKDEVLEIVQREAALAGAQEKDIYNGERLPVRYSVDEQNRELGSKLPGTPHFDLDHAFPSPVKVERIRKSFDDSASRPNYVESSKVKIQVKRKGISGLKASFQAQDGREWFWKTNGPLIMGSQPSATGAPTGIAGGSGLSGTDMQLYALDGMDPVQLATYSSNSLPRNTLGLFKPKPKQPIPPARQVQLGPAVGIRGAKPIRSNSNANKQRLFQNRRAAVSTDSLIRSDDPSNLSGPALGRTSLQLPMPSNSPDVFDNEAGAPVLRPPKRMGDVKFLPDCYDHDLATVSLLALIGMVKI